MLSGQNPDDLNRPLPQVDTEGAEALVLGGARELLASGRVRNLVVEIASAHWF